MMTRQDQHKTEGKAFTYPPEHERSLIKSLACAKAAIDKKCEKLKIWANLFLGGTYSVKVLK